jgi:hypothetical protein
LVTGDAPVPSMMRAPRKATGWFWPNMVPTAVANSEIMAKFPIRLRSPEIASTDFTLNLWF